MVPAILICGNGEKRNIHQLSGIQPDTGTDGKNSKAHCKSPRELSFKTAQETLVSFLQTLPGASGDWLEQKIVNMLDSILLEIDLVGWRAVKNWPKPHKRLQHSRSQARRLKKYQGK